MGLVVPTMEVVSEKQNTGIKFVASVLDSILMLPEDKLFPLDDIERGLLEIRLQVPESGLLFKANSVISFHVEGIGDLYSSKRNIAVAKLLNDGIRNNSASRGVFGGAVRLDETFYAGSLNYIHLNLGYAEFPKDSGIVYIFDRKAPLTLK